MNELILVLDKSGSMMSCADSAVSGFNSLINEQKKLGAINVTVIWFDNSVSVDFEGDISKINLIEKWPLGGMTALHDGIGKAFTHTEKRFSKEKPEKVILAIMTDGHENASIEHNEASIAELVKHHESKYGWEVIFMAADQDAWAAAQHLGMRQVNTVSYASAQTCDAYSDMSRAVTDIRNK